MATQLRPCTPYMMKLRPLALNRKRLSPRSASQALQRGPSAARIAACALSSGRAGLRGLIARPRVAHQLHDAEDSGRDNEPSRGAQEAGRVGLGQELPPRATSRGTGFTHLRYRLSDRGIPAFDGGLRVSLDRGGRVLSAIASPAPQADSAAPRLGAVDALRALQRDVGVERRVGVVSGPAGVRRTTHFEGGDFARLVLFGSGRGTRLAWHLTYRASDADHYDAVVDADSGAVLFRQNLVKDAVPAQVFPSHPAQSASTSVDLTPWLDPGATVLEGPFAHAYSDSDDDPLTAGEEIQKTGGGFVFPFQAFGGLGCDPTALCSWDRSIPHSWKDNRKQNGVQAFYLVNRFRDHLANDPNIAFDGFRDADPVLVETDDGASTDPGGPDNEHINNASMATLPEGISRGWSSSCSSATASAPSTAATPPPSSGTSTRTGCPTAWSCTTTARARCPARRRGRWGRDGATGSRSTCSSGTG